MARVLYLDCYSGASGDMLIGALLDAGLPFELLRAALGSLALEDECAVSVERVSRSGVGASKFVVTETAADTGRHRHRHLPGITKLVDRSALSAAAKATGESVVSSAGGDRGGDPPDAGREGAPARSGRARLDRRHCRRRVRAGVVRG